MPTKYPIWQEYYEHRLDWAYTAKDDFIKSIDNETFRGLYNQNSNKTVNIAVYGRSQVGKTTLILELIGIKKEYREYVSTILRADIPPGQSVTPTSIIYQKSKDDNFYFIEGDLEWLVDEEKLKQKLKDLRDRVESNVELRSLAGVESNILIKIPEKFFEEVNSLNINIIDLPGFGSANDKEQRHVKKVIENIIPILNLVLIVSNKITDLEKSDKPCRHFRYILTRSVSSDSVRKKFEEDAIKDIDTYEKFVRSEFEELPDNVKVYPLEYGESWDKLDKKIKNKAENIIAELFEALRKDISDSSTDYNQLMQNVHNYKHIEEIIDRELGKFKEKIEVKEKELENLKNDLKHLNQSYNSCLEEKKDFINSKFLFENYLFNYPYPAYHGEITVPKLKKFLSTFINGICGYAAGEWKKIIRHKNYSDIQCKQTLDFYKITNKEAYLIRKRLDDYWFESYLTNNDQTDKKECEAVCKKINNQIKNKIEANFAEVVENFNNDVDNKIIEQEKRVKYYSFQISEIQKFVKEVKDELTELESKRIKFKINSKKNLANAKKFKDYIRKGYANEKNKVIKGMNDIEKSKEQKFFNLLYLSLLSSEFKKLINQPPL